MTFTTWLKESKIFHLSWIFLFLGSCTLFQTDSAGIFGLSRPIDGPEMTCGEFRPTLRLNHTRPTFPTVNVTHLTDEDRLDILMAHVERLTEYLNNDERYLAEDMMAYRLKCALVTDQVVFKKQ